MCNLPVTIPAGGHLCEVDSAVSEHEARTVRHLAVHAVVDDHVVHDVLHVRLVLLDHSVLLLLALQHHLIQINLSLQQKLGSPLLLTKTVVWTLGIGYEGCVEGP